MAIPGCRDTPQRRRGNLDASLGFGARCTIANLTAVSRMDPFAFGSGDHCGLRCHVSQLAARPMLVNVFVPHLPAALWFRSYAPGVVTAVLVNLPLMSYLAVRALREQWV